MNKIVVLVIAVSALIVITTLFLTTNKAGINSELYFDNSFSGELRLVLNKYPDDFENEEVIINSQMQSGD
ncbi:MAG: hypothetical protein IKR04_01360 [Clostridia bacterium]|nr:hypothetical protein [Clostridia bacterium]